MAEPLAFSSEFVRSAKSALFAAQHELQHSTDPTERAVSVEFFQYWFMLENTRPQALLEALGRLSMDRRYYEELGTTLVRLRELQERTGRSIAFNTPEPEREPGWRAMTSEWGKRFITEFLRELREAVCGTNNEYSAVKEEFRDYPKAIAVAASTATVNSLGVSNPMALGIATLALLIVSRASKNALCKSTEAEILAEVERQAASP